MAMSTILPETWCRICPRQSLPGRSLVDASKVGTLDGSTRRTILAAENGLTVFVELKLRDDTIRRLDSNIHLCAICLVPCDPFNVNDIFPAVAGCDFTLAILVYATHDHDLIILANGNRSYIILGL